MPLTNCPDCGKEISDTARTCIQCGYRKQQSIFSQYDSDGIFFKLAFSFGLVCILSGLFVGWWLSVFGVALAFTAVLGLAICSLK